MALTNCHLAKSGLRTYTCADDAPLQSCTQALGRDAVAFGTYNTFFAHVDNICFYLQREAFQETTERAVADLLSATVDTSRHLQKFSSEVTVARLFISAPAQQLTQACARLPALFACFTHTGAAGVG